MTEKQTVKSDRESMRKELRRWANLKKEKDDKEREIDDINKELSQLYGLRPRYLDGVPCGTGLGDPTGNAVAKNEEKVASLKAKKKRAECSIEKIDAQMFETVLFLSRLPAAEKKVLELRYIKYGSKNKYIWERIGDEMGYSADHAKRLERQGVDRLITIKS